VAGPLNLLAAMLLLFLSLGPFAMAAAMRISVES
jgi:heme exporter protein B